MLNKEELDAARTEFKDWVQKYKIARRFEQGDETAVESESENLVWSVVWNWDEKDAQVLPGLHVNEDTSAYYLGQEPWGDDAWEEIVCEAVTIACEDCQGNGVNADEEPCETCDGQGNIGDELEELSSEVNFQGKPLA